MMLKCNSLKIVFMLNLKTYLPAVQLTEINLNFADHMNIEYKFLRVFQASNK